MRKSLRVPQPCENYSSLGRHFSGTGRDAAGLLWPEGFSALPEVTLSSPSYGLGRLAAGLYLVCPASCAQRSNQRVLLPRSASFNLYVLCSPSPSSSMTSSIKLSGPVPKMINPTPTVIPYSSIPIKRHGCKGTEVCICGKDFADDDDCAEHAAVCGQVGRFKGFMDQFAP